MWLLFKLLILCAEKKMSNKLTRFLPDLILVLLLLLLIGMQWQALHLPYYWDEAWVYVPAVNAMVLQGPSLMPGSIDPNLYTGHPLMFYFLSASWLQWFGYSVFNAHLFALLLAILFLISLYIILQLHGQEKWTSLFVTLICGLQSIFLAQSTFVLSEILLSIFIVWALHFYVHHRYWAYVIFAVFAMNTKEPGFVLIPVVVINEMLKCIKYKRKLDWNLFSRFALLVLPGLVAFSFFVIQKYKLGWMFFPRHYNWVDFSVQAILTKASAIFQFLFLSQGRSLLLVSLVFTGLFWLRRNFLLAFIPSILLAVVVINFSFHHTTVWLTIFSAIFLTLYFAILWFANYKGKLVPESDNRLLTYLIFAIIFSSFFCINFLSMRYLWACIPFFILASLLWHLEWMKADKKIAFGFALIFITNFLTVLPYNATKAYPGDVELSYRKMVNFHQQAVRYCEVNIPEDDIILTHFLMMNNLTNSLSGYRSGEKVFRNCYNHHPNPQWVILSVMELDDELRPYLSNQKYQLVKEWNQGQSWCRIYKRK